ncbi:glycosyltransferase family 1 protein [Lentzea tibetensis]|uniref:Glycosyltransferase family 1 protein n=1 Tax=Lentzea tibetensis TaxID=2591470 RepID=A0A563F166_9PSEU|nr:glycosyltransferase [Lentzea tibetensis]TWP53659.1 glycosyltransferase family 1 protein [Lentzea tibetensis]
MRIAMVSEHASPLPAPDAVDVGPQSRHVAELAAALCRHGHEVTVYTRRDAPHLPDLVRADRGYQVVHVPAGPAERLESLPHLGDFTNVLVEHWNANAPDVVHAHFWTSGLASVLASRRTGVPVVQSYHELGIAASSGDGSTSKRTDVERLLAREAAHVVANCSNEAFDLIRMGMNRSRISVIPSGVDIDAFTPDGPRAGRTLPRRVVTFGHLLPRSGLDHIIAALPALDDAELVIAGRSDDASEAKRLRALTVEFGVAERVVFAGEVARSAQPALLRSADVVVCGPWCDRPDALALEAMACGAPVVTTAVGGLVDAVVNGVTGRHVPPRDPGALTRTLHSLLASDTDRYEFGIAGRDRVCARYSWDRIASDTLRVYERARMLARQAPGARVADRPSSG